MVNVPGKTSAESRPSSGRAGRFARSVSKCVRRPKKEVLPEETIAPHAPAAEKEQPEIGKDDRILEQRDDKGEAFLCQRKLARSVTAGSTRSTTSMREAVLEMSCDILCIRTMTVVYTDTEGVEQTTSRSGYNVKIRVPAGSTDVKVSFAVVGGAAIYKVDREDPRTPWVKDASGKSVPELFEYATCPQHIQYFIRGLSLRSMVWWVDERKSNECLFEMVSKDIRSIRTMQIMYTDKEGERQQWAGTGYNVSCHLPSSATDVEVTFLAMGRPVGKVDRRDPKLPWVNDFCGERLPERFEYARCPQCVQYDIRGTLLTTHVSHVYEQVDDEEDYEENEWPHGPSQDEKQLYLGPVDQVPAIGGVMDLQEPHSEYLLPAEVALYEPKEEDIFGFVPGEQANASKKGTARQIFLNTPLTQDETAALAEFRSYLAKQNDAIPRFAELHLLRILQTCKFNMKKSADMIKLLEKERVRRLPVAEADVLTQLKSGFIYWHGRDRSCRPALVVRCERLGEFSKDREKAVQTMLFALEYIIRYGMVPGRVENWVAIIDLQNVLSVISLSQCMGLISTAVAIGNTLERVFCGRMVWVKIINMPGSAMLARGINSVIPAEKKHKVSFPTDVAGELAKCFEPNQLEQRYGGEQPDIVPGEAYPFRFFPNPRGDDVLRGSSQSGGLGGLADRSPSALQDSGDYSLHESTNLEFHEGFLWDTSAPPASKAAWLERAKVSSLAPASATALAEVEGGSQVEPCRDVDKWLALTGSSAASQYCKTTTSSRSLGTKAPSDSPKSSSTCSEVIRLSEFKLSL